jgi:hypothetical protein
MSAEESFLRRWLRLKRQAQSQPAEPDKQEPVESDAPPQLPPIEELSFDSDFKGFMHPKVDRETRSAALKKLFMSPHYQVSDGLDVYVGDYSSPDVLPAAMLSGLVHARSLLTDDKPEQAAGVAAANAAPATPAAEPEPEPGPPESPDTPAPPREQG